MAAQLTPNACARLRNPADYHILLCSPVLEVENVDRDVDPVIRGAATAFGFDLSDKATTLVDSSGSELCVFFPSGRAPFGSSADFPGVLRKGDFVQLQKLVRIPAGNGSAIVVWDVEVCTDVPLVVSNVENRVKELETELAKTQATLTAMTQPHVKAELLDSVMAILNGLNEIISQSMA